MTQIQPFPTPPFPAIALVVAEGDEISADPAAFLALAGEDTASLHDEAEVTVSMSPPPVTGWPISSLVAAEVPTAPLADGGEAEVQMAPRAAVSAPRPMVTGAVLLPPPEMTGLAEEAAVDRRPEAEASDPAAPVPVQAPDGALVPLAAVVLPAQVGTGTTVAATPDRVEGVGLVTLTIEVVSAADPSDRVAPKWQDHDSVLQASPKTIVAAESAKATFAAPVDTEPAGPQMQDTASRSVVFGPEDAILSGQKAVSVMQAVPAGLSVLPETFFPATPSPIEPAAIETQVAKGNAPAVDRTAEQGAGREVVVNPPDSRMDRGSLPLPQPGMTREERLWRSLWPAAEARSAPIVVAKEIVTPAPDERAALPALPAMAEVEGKVADGPDAVSPLAKPEPPVPVADRAGPAGSGPVNASAPPLPGMVTPMGDPVPHILPPARVLPGDPAPAAPAPAPAPPVPVQIVQALSSGGGAVTELRLAPEELGHVRIDMRHEGDRLVMTVSAERQDTLDLLRRHAGELAAELRAAGHSGLDLSFGHWSGPRPGPDDQSGWAPEAEAFRPEIPQDAAGAAIEAIPPQPPGGLYLRI